MATQGTMTSLHYFFHRYGPEGLWMLLELLNEHQWSHTAIAASWQCDRGGLTRFINAHMDRPYILKPHVWEYCEHLEKIRREQFETERRRQSKILRFVGTRSPVSPPSV